MGLSIYVSEIFKFCHSEEVITHQSEEIIHYSKAVKGFDISQKGGREEDRNRDIHTERDRDNW